ncbi:MAG: guanylate kinase [Candidatus Peregrinibacteria bacterium]
MTSSSRITGTSSGHAKGKLVLIIGPSGVGKSVVLLELKKHHPEFVFPRSATTRKQRSGESDDLYRFLSDEEFDALVTQDQVLEWAQVHEGARYGTLEEEIVPALTQGKTVVREVDIQGFHSIRTHALFSGKEARFPLVSIFILPESRDGLIERIRKRAPIEEEELQRRIASMDKELKIADLCTARVVNRDDQLDVAVHEVEEVILGE